MYDWIVKYTTFGCDSLWKQNIANFITPEYKNILDVACGIGIFSSFISKIPFNNLIGVDLHIVISLMPKQKENIHF